MKVTVHDQLEAIGAEAWQQLHARMRFRSPFLTWTWQSEWLRAFGDGRRLEVWRVDDASDGLVAVLPLVETAPGLLRIPGGTDVSDYLDLLAVEGREEEAWTVLLSARAAARVVWDLHCVPSSSPTVTALPGFATAFGLVAAATIEERCPVLDLPDSWAAYLDALPGKQRHELRRKLRRFARDAPEARTVCARTAPEIEARLGDFFALHRRSAAGKARFMDPVMEGFFHRTAAALAEQGLTKLWVLDDPSGPLAAFITLEWDGTVGLYNSGFDPARAALSPGVVLLANLVRDAIERGQRRFDFLRGEERYKYDFGPRPEDVYTVVLR
jgi:CelD/BcsL family acetyltransferase involved in cellulose biosynthesis